MKAALPGLTPVPVPVPVNLSALIEPLLDEHALNAMGWGWPSRNASLVPIVGSCKLAMPQAAAFRRASPCHSIFEPQ